MIDFNQKDCFLRSGFLCLLLILSGFVFYSTSAFAEETSLESQLNELKVPGNMAPQAVTQERLYSVQSRYSDLKHKSEISLGSARNFNSSSFVNMQQVELAYRFHFNNHWNLGLSGSYGFNSLTAGSKELLNQGSRLPDAAFVKKRVDLLLGYNLFYGKFRISMDQVMYFDQYVAAGPGLVSTQYGNSYAAVADVGFSFWMNKKMNIRMGLKNEYFNEKRFLDSSRVLHMLGHLDVGYTFGGSKYE